MATIGLIGAGHIGSQVARLAIASGYDVVISNSRGPQTLSALVKELGTKARAGTALAHSELSRAQDMIVKTIGVTPTWYRPAGGEHNKAVDREAARMHLKVIRWTIDSGDYRKPDPGKMARWVVRKARTQRRPVVLMHDGGGDRTQTILALPRIIDRLKRYGYHFVTLDEMNRK